MTLDVDSCYRALGARDRRFDGLFFVGVETTGIYCRPVCPARTPARSRCVFFERAAQAERAGFRACFRCRPELAPGAARVDALPRLVARAVRLVDDGFLDSASVDDLAASLDVSARHLRRAMEAELGVSPLELAQTRRLALAKQLLTDTSLPLTQIAFASGFGSVRRFNSAFHDRFGRAPSALRRERGVQDETVELALEYRPPLDWDALLSFLGARAIPGVELVASGTYRRTVVVGEASGWLEVAPHPSRPALAARLSLSLVPHVATIVRRLRAQFDLDARPDVIASALAADPLLAPSVAARPGLRVPGAFDVFELAVRAVLGQQVSVRAASTLAGRFAERFGRALDVPEPGFTFPSAQQIAGTGAGDIAAIGLPAKRAASIVALSRALAGGQLELDAAPAQVVERLVALPGIGPWTAEYIALRALRWPDAFPAGDLALRRALGVDRPRDAIERARSWQPFRAYAVMHLWTPRRTT